MPLGINENLNSASLAFSSSITIRENQYKCTIRDNEYSYTTNPSALRPLNQVNHCQTMLFQNPFLSTQYNDDNGDPWGLYFKFNLDVDKLVRELVEQSIVTVADGGGSPNNVISNITTNNPGRNYAPGDILVLNPSPLLSQMHTGLIGLSL